MMSVHDRVAAGGSVGSAARWVDPRYGPIVGLYSCRERSGFALYVLRLAKPTFGRQQWSDPALTGSGCALEDVVAWDRACGEAIERYAALDHDYEDELGWMAADDPRSLLPEFPRCADIEPCPPGFKHRFGDEEVVAHCEVTRVSDGSGAWAPAGFAHLNYAPAAGEPAVNLGISTGLAYHEDLTSAVWGGVCEAIERDALMLTWWARRDLARIELPDSDSGPLGARVDRIVDDDTSLYLFDMSAGLPCVTVLALLVSEEFPYIVVGAGASGEPNSAACKAIDEVISVRWSVSRQEPKPTVLDGDYWWVRSLADHANFYANCTERKPVEFLLGSEQSCALDEAGGGHRGTPAGWSELVALAETMEESGHPVYWLELQQPTYDFEGHAVKVMMPSLLPLSQSHAVRWLDTPRLQGFLDDREPNPFPHPFA